MWPQGPAEGAGVTDGGGDGPVELGAAAAGAPHGSTALSSIKEDWQERRDQHKLLLMI